MSKKVSKFEKYLYEEIGIEFKACMYFCVILLFYCLYRWNLGFYTSRNLYLAEMIFSTYIMGYIQIYIFSGVDESKQIGKIEVLQMIFCSAVYAGLSYILCWFDRNIPVTLGFFAYMLFTYVCAYLIYKVRRTIDERLLNEDLEAFQARKPDKE